MKTKLWTISKDIKFLCDLLLTIRWISNWAYVYINHFWILYSSQHFKFQTKLQYTMCMNVNFMREWIHGGINNSVYQQQTSCTGSYTGIQTRVIRDRNRQDRRNISLKKPSHVAPILKKKENEPRKRLYKKKWRQ